MTESVARTRQGLYRFFGEALLSPDDDRLGILAGAADVLGRRDIDGFPFSLAWRRMAGALPTEVAGSRLDVDYVRLFASGRSAALAPPTESYYRISGKGGGIAEFVSELQREYRRMGVVLTGLEEAPDHVSTEMEVMAHLCDVEAQGWERGATDEVDATIAVEHRFLTHHLRVWIPQFRRRVTEAPPAPFYSALVEAVHAFVVHEVDYLALVRSELAR